MCCEVFAKALPVIPLFKAAPAAVRRLVELAADDRAAQATSPDAVRSALRVVATSPLPQPVWTLGLGDDEISVRLVRLQTDSRIRGTKLVLHLCCDAPDDRSRHRRVDHHGRLLCVRSCPRDLTAVGKGGRGAHPDPKTMQRSIWVMLLSHTLFASRQEAG